MWAVFVKFKSDIYPYCGQTLYNMLGIAIYIKVTISACTINCRHHEENTVSQSAAIHLLGRSFSQRSPGIAAILKRILNFEKYFVSTLN